MKTFEVTSRWGRAIVMADTPERAIELANDTQKGAREPEVFDEATEMSLPQGEGVVFMHIE